MNNNNNKNSNKIIFVLFFFIYQKQILKKEMNVTELQWYGYCMFRALASLHKQVESLLLSLSLVHLFSFSLRYFPGSSAQRCEAWEFLVFAQTKQRIPH